MTAGTTGVISPDFLLIHVSCHTFGVVRCLLNVQVFWHAGFVLVELSAFGCVILQVVTKTAKHFCSFRDGRF